MSQDILASIISPKHWKTWIGHVERNLHYMNSQYMMRAVTLKFLRDVTCHLMILYSALWKVQWDWKLTSSVVNVLRSFCKKAVTIMWFLMGTRVMLIPSVVVLKNWSRAFNRGFSSIVKLWFNCLWAASIKIDRSFIYWRADKAVAQNFKEVMRPKVLQPKKRKQRSRTTNALEPKKERDVLWLN